MDPLGCLARTGKLSGGLNGAFARLSAAANSLGDAYPEAGLIRIDARMVHEAGGSDAQELATLIASAVDTLRRLDNRADISALVPRMSFAIALTQSKDGVTERFCPQRFRKVLIFAPVESQDF